MKKILIVPLLFLINSCGTNNTSTKIVRIDTTKNTKEVHVSTSSISKTTLSKIKGVNWISDESDIITLFLDSISVDYNKNDKYSDTFYYNISNKSCESDSSSRKESSEIVYLKRTTKKGKIYCYSVEDISDTSLILMSLNNGNLWTLSKEHPH